MSYNEYSIIKDSIKNSNFYVNDKIKDEFGTDECFSPLFDNGAENIYDDFSDEKAQDSNFQNVDCFSKESSSQQYEYQDVVDKMNPFSDAFHWS